MEIMEDEEDDSIGRIDFADCVDLTDEFVVDSSGDTLQDQMAEQSLKMDETLVAPTPVDKGDLLEISSDEIDYIEVNSN